MSKYRKALVAALVAALTAAQQAVPMSDPARAWLTVALAVLGVAGVYLVPNEARTTGVRTLAGPPGGYDR